MDTTPKNKKAMTKDEVVLLVELIQNNHIIISKETNASTNKLKKEAWISVAAAFNAKSGSYPRFKEQLKLKWDNLKKAARKRTQQIRMNNLKTGGGKPDFIPPDEILDKVASLLGSTCTGFEVPFGGDGVTGGGVVLDVEILDEFGDGTEFQDRTTFDDAGVKVPNDDLFPNNKQAKRRKIEFGFEEATTNMSKKFLYGMPTMSKFLQNKGKNKKFKPDDGRTQRNLAIAKYYEKKAEKIELEIKLLKIEIENKEKNNCNLNS